VARNLHAKFGGERTVSQFFTIFFKQKPPSCGGRDVIVTSRPPAERFRRTIPGWRGTLVRIGAAVCEFIQNR
jgi:hypothetical protein